MNDSPKTSGGQPGNDNARRGTSARDSLRRSICRHAINMKEAYLEEHGEEFPDDGRTNYEIGMDLVSGGMIDGVKGARETYREVADRMDGKAVQAVELTGGNGGPVGVSYKMEFPDGDDPSADST